MNQLRNLKPLVLVGVGLAMGLLVGVGMMLGTLVSAGFLAGGPVIDLGETQLNAMASDSTDSFAVATGPISDGVEGVFFLDFYTGELQCWVPNPRTGALGGRFQHNVIADLGVERGKKPRYLIVTGQASFRSGGGAIQPAESVVYVVDANTGRFAAYTLPWNRNLAASSVAAQFAPMALLGKGSARNVEIRGE